MSDAAFGQDPVALCTSRMEKRKPAEIQIVASMDGSTLVNPVEDGCQQPASKRACADHGLSESEVYSLRRRLKNKLCEEALVDLQDAIVRPEDLDVQKEHSTEDPGQEPAETRAHGDQGMHQGKTQWGRPMTFVAKQRVLKTASIVQALLCFGVINAVVFRACPLKASASRSRSSCIHCSTVSSRPPKRNAPMKAARRVALSSQDVCLLITCQGPRHSTFTTLT